MTDSAAAAAAAAAAPAPAAAPKNISWTRITPSPDPNAINSSVPCTRSSHGLSMVQNGTRLILLGGEHVARTPISGNEGSYWIADKVGEEEDNNTSWTWTWTWKWRCLNSNHDPAAVVEPPDRIAHAQAVHDDKFVYIFGGRAGITMDEQAMNDLWKLDCSGEPGTEHWVQVHYNSGSGSGSGSSSPPEARSFHRMICMDQSLYVFGGCSAEHGRLADLHRFDLETSTWHELGASPLLRGRGGANVIPLCGGTKIAVIAGFCGEETNDGHVFDLSTGKWDDQLVMSLKDMRPRSVCISGSLPSLGYSLIFGGEVDPSDRGHEGAGGFDNDLVVLDETTGAFLTSFQASPSPSPASIWPQSRGWSDGATVDDTGTNECGLLYFFGGLSGDDKNPQRLDDLWRLEIEK
jgi:hypothetical protein